MLQPLAPAVFSSALEEAKRAHLSSDFARARRLYENLLAHYPNEPAPQVLLAELDLRDGRLVTARHRLERIAAEHPESHETRVALANVLQELGDVNATTALYREEVAQAPDSLDAWAKFANALQIAGQIDDAAGAYGKIVGAWPDKSVGYFGLAAIDPKRITVEQVARLQGIAQRGSPHERIQALFALGTVLEGRGQFDEAFEAFSTGNRLKCENPDLGEAPPNGALVLPTGPPPFTSVKEAERQHENFVRETKAMFSVSYIARFAGNGDPSRAPIFIVGMPRSGSTLLEQILSSHPDVQGLGETSALSRVFRAGLAAVQRDPSGAAGFYRGVGAAYLDALRELGWDGRRHVIDKMLANYINVGIIHLALPNAVVLHTMRDPVDTCLSSFRQLFGKRNETSYDLGASGRQYVRYREMIAHWDAVLPGRVVHVEHEALVANPERMIPAVVAACGLSWHDDCLHFEKNVRTVRTASVNQVRRPISTAAVQRWRKYERHLGPLFAALGPYAPERSSSAL